MNLDDILKTPMRRRDVLKLLGAAAGSVALSPYARAFSLSNIVKGDKTREEIIRRENYMHTQSLQEFLSLPSPINPNKVISGIHTLDDGPETIYIGPGTNPADVNLAIENSSPGDTIHFNDGDYYVPYGQFWELLPDRDYTFGNCNVSGGGLEHSGIFRIVYGGNMNIVGNGTLALKNSRIAIAIGNNRFDNIQISGIDFSEIYLHAIGYENRQHVSPLEHPAIIIQSCTGAGGYEGDKFVMYAEGITTANSPYARVENCTVVGHTSDGGAIDLPVYVVEVLNNPGSTSIEVAILGNDDIVNNAFDDCIAMTRTDLYSYFASPEFNVFGPDITAYLKENYDDDPDNDIEDYNIADSCGNIQVENLGLGQGFVPQLDSPLIVFDEGGRIIGYLGAKPPEIPGDFNRDFFVNQRDIALIAAKWQTRPGDPRWDPRYDLNGNGVIGFGDIRIQTGYWLQGR